MTTIILMTILAMTLLVTYKSVMAKKDGSREAPFTQDDRDRLIRLETKVDEGQKALNQRIDDLRRLMGVRSCFLNFNLLLIAKAYKNVTSKKSPYVIPDRIR